MLLTHVTIWLHPGAGLAPYSHSTPLAAHVMPGAGAFAGHGDVAPPLLLPLLPPLEPPLPPPLPPLLLPLPPDPPLELALPLLDPELPFPSLPASVFDVDVAPPQPAPAPPTHNMAAAVAAAPIQGKHRM